jgi:adenylate cyclase
MHDQVSVPRPIDAGSSSYTNIWDSRAELLVTAADIRVGDSMLDVASGPSTVARLAAPRAGAGGNGGSGASLCGKKARFAFLAVEFASIVDAVCCAVDVQRAMAGHNADKPEARRIEFRMGINVGDIIIEDGDIFGDGVNIAARLEALAEPGGICVSSAAHEQVRDKLDFPFEDMGDQQV